MEFLFLILALGCLAFLGKIVMDYMREAPEWTNKTRASELERDQYEGQIDGLVSAKEGAAERSKSIGEEIKTLEKMRDDLKVEIEKQKKEMARKGRIIMNRQSQQ
ncbi:MAG: hypothetical protein QGI83_21690 [Candidatus Latescibacteria bacterium]|nr:hypothetical protein [Candidatus Latescibacterota bacterium]